jgi:hypothetical protein
MSGSFEGEGNPIHLTVDLPPEELPILLEEVRQRYEASASGPSPHTSDVVVGPDGALTVHLTVAEREALRALLERETTSRPSYDGLRGLLSLTNPQNDALLGLLRRLS